MGKLVKILVPVLGVVAVGVFAWMFLESSGSKDDAERAAGAMLSAADQAIAAATAKARFRAEEEENYVAIGGILTSTANLQATLVVNGTDGVEAVCNRMAHVRDYLVVLLSEYPPDPRDVTAGPNGFGGSMPSEIDALLERPSVERVRFDTYQIGQQGVKASC